MGNRVNSSFVLNTLNLDFQWMKKHPYFTSGPLINQNYLVKWKIVEKEEQRMLALAMRIRAGDRKTPDVKKSPPKTAPQTQPASPQRSKSAEELTTTANQKPAPRRRRPIRTRSKGLVTVIDNSRSRRSIKTIPEADQEEDDEEQNDSDLPVSRGKEVLRPLSAPTNGSRGGGLSVKHEDEEEEEEESGFMEWGDSEAEEMEERVEGEGEGGGEEEYRMRYDDEEEEEIKEEIEGNEKGGEEEDAEEGMVTQSDEVVEEVVEEAVGGAEEEV